MMKILVMYSSLTGNTAKVAAAIHTALPSGSVLAKITPQLDMRNYDLIFAGFWVDKGTADQAAKTALLGLQNKKVALFATLGAAPNTIHAQNCLQEAAALLHESNTLLGSYYCQGKIDPQLLERFKSLTADHPHALTPEATARHQAAATHPDAADLQAAGIFAKNILAKLL
ncbi:flavodoxin family protein [uncultured Phascolarctobacterium sp.]|uniref:flavodoxin family protein n=1 Tax=uncultured Phascolarctobacterium sp. TaxID=512296 RepID=UPI0025EF0155|nr:flavodoxin family protein [uncultured Phascolarctobacterium sp.]